MDSSEHRDSYLAAFRWGDALIVLVGIAFVALLFNTLWLGEVASKVQIRAGDRVFSTLSLNQNRTVEVPGPLGYTVVAIENGRVRVASDPSPRQYCVHQGWLTQAGQVAMCLPNQVSVELIGNSKPYDSLNY